MRGTVRRATGPDGARSRAPRSSRRGPAASRLGADGVHRPRAGRRRPLEGPRPRGPRPPAHRSAAPRRPRCRVLVVARTRRRWPLPLPTGRLGRPRGRCLTGRTAELRRPRGVSWRSGGCRARRRPRAHGRTGAETAGPGPRPRARRSRHPGPGRRRCAGPVGARPASARHPRPGRARSPGTRTKPRLGGARGPSAGWMCLHAGRRRRHVRGDSRCERTGPGIGRRRRARSNCAGSDSVTERRPRTCDDMLTSSQLMSRCLPLIGAVANSRCGVSLSFPRGSAAPRHRDGG